MKRVATSFLVSIILLTGCSRTVGVTSLTCEYEAEPLSVTASQPLFGWKWQVPDNFSDSQNQAVQTAYQLEVVDSEGNVVWNTGVISRRKSQLVQYEGEPLKPLADYSWRVRVWDGQGNDKGWSERSMFRTAPSEDWLDSEWIGAITRSDSRLPEGRQFEGNIVNRDSDKKEAWNNTDTLSKKSICLRKDFTAERKVRKAVVYVCGLGHYELTLNGEKVGDEIFTPLWSDYDKTLYYNVYDVTSLLRRRNALGVLLGNGFFNEQGGRYRKLLVSFGPPTLWLKLHVEYSDGSFDDIRSDGSWKYAFSALTFNDLYGGESYDARLEQKGWDTYGFDDSSWRDVVLQEAPKGRLSPQLAPSVKSHETYSVQSSWRRTCLPKPKKSAPWTLSGDSVQAIVTDMGQNLAGYPVIRVKGHRGDVVRLLVGESLSPDSLVSQVQSGGPYFYEYTLKGDGTESWHPRFSYYGFRYIEIQGAVLSGMPNPDGLPVLEELQSCFIYNSAPVVGSFESSNTLFNGVHRLIQMAVRSNMQSVFTDCPHREKLGWLEQLQLNGRGLLYNYDLTTFWPKILQDMADAQYPNGFVPTTAPMFTEFSGYWNNSPEWGSSCVMLPFQYYERYGDDRLIRQFYPVMKAYTDYLEASSDNHIVTLGLGDWYDYAGVRCGFAQNTPVPLSGTAHLYYDAKLVARAAAMLGYEDDAAKYKALASEVNRAFHEKYFRADSCIYGTGSQCSYAMPLYMGMVPDSLRQTALQHLIDDIHAHGDRLTTGEVGNRYMFELLADEGYDELMYAMHNHQEVPGYGFQLKFGATTLTEQWDPRQGASWNHFMLGAIDEWFFNSLAGIRYDIERPGGQHLIIHPAVVGDLRWVKASTRTLYGEVSIDWKYTEQAEFVMTVTIPGNTTASVWLPDASTPVEVPAGTTTMVAEAVSSTTTMVAVGTGSPSGGRAGGAGWGDR